MDATLPAVARMSPGWVDFILMAGAFLLVAVGAAIWLFFRRKPKRRRKHRQQSESRPLNPTLAQSGGLPPIRRQADPAPNPPPTSPT